MLERDDWSRNETFEESFSKIVSSEHFIDAGLVSFEKEVNGLCAELNGACGNDEVDENSIHSDINDAEYYLNSLWQFHGEMAKVSGRVVLEDNNDVTKIPLSWGTPQSDEDGSIFYIVDNLKVASNGIEVAPTYDELDEEPRAVRVDPYYSFSHELSDGEFVDLYVGLGDLWKHEYENPTPEGALAILESRWPQELKLIDKIITSNMYATAIPDRIAYLTERLNDQLQSSSEFRTIAQLYIDSKIELDTITPYILKVSGPVSLNISNIDTIAASPDGWRDYEILDETVILGYAPIVSFLPGQGDESATAGFMVGIYNEEREEGMDVPEKIFVPLDSISEFRSSRSIQSLASRAVQSSMPDGDDLALQRLKDSLTSLAGVSLDEVQLDYSDSQDTSSAISEEGLARKHGGDHAEEGETIERLPGRYEQFRIIEEFTDNLIKMGEMLKSTLFETEAEAVGYVSEHLNSFMAQNMHMYEALMDNKVAVAMIADGNVVIHNSDDTSATLAKEEYPNLTFINTNITEPYKVIDSLDSISGVFSRLAAVAYEVLGEDGDVIGYRGAPSYSLVYSRNDYVFAENKGLPILRGNIEHSAIVPLDGTASVVVKEASYYRGVINMLDKVTESSKDETMELADDLHLVAGDILLSKDNDNLVSLTEIESLNRLGALITDAGESAGTAAAARMALDTLDELFTQNAMVFTSGSIVVDEQGNRHEYQLTAEMGYLITMDVRADVIPGDVVLVVNGGAGSKIYIPISKITDLRF